ncbi:MAG: nucleotidyltransferase family protein [Bacillota bacterium]|nr:nucleotidyltransferase family protein [Bacillota bacterium]
MIIGIILASGFSKRFGKNDKLLSKIEGKTIIEMVCNNIVESNLDEIILVYKNEKINKLIKHKEITKIRNYDASKGMSESLKIGVKNSNSLTKGYMFLMGDQPFIDKDIINVLINEFKKHKGIILPVFNKKKSSPTIFSVKYKNELMNLEGDTGGRNLIKKYNKDVFEVYFKNNYNIDIDKVDDLETIN